MGSKCSPRIDLLLWVAGSFQCHDWPSYQSHCSSPLPYSGMALGRKAVRQKAVWPCSHRWLDSEDIRAEWVM